LIDVVDLYKGLSRLENPSHRKDKIIIQIANSAYHCGKLKRSITSLTHPLSLPMKAAVHWERFAQLKGKTTDYKTMSYNDVSKGL